LNFITEMSTESNKKKAYQKHVNQIISNSVMVEKSTILITGSKDPTSLA